MTSTPTKILIADDEDDIRLLIRIVLERNGFEVLEARDGYETVEMTTSQLPDLLLLDVRMPRMTGLEALDVLKANPQTRDIPILIVSAYAQEADIAAGIARGATGYLTKPFGPQELIARIKVLLESRVVTEQLPS